MAEVMGAAYDKLEEVNRRDNIAAAEALRKNGLKEVDANPEDIPVWYSVAADTNAKM